MPCAQELAVEGSPECCERQVERQICITGPSRVGFPRAAADCGRTEPSPGALVLVTMDSEEIRVIIFIDMV